MEATEPQNAFYLVHCPTIWERLGFKGAYVPRPNEDEQAPGYAPSWMMCDTFVYLDWRDRLRVLWSGRIMVQVAIKTDVVVHKHSATSAIGILPPAGVRVRWIGRYDPGNRLLRLVRVMWEHGQAGNGGYSVKLSLGLCPTLFRWLREGDGWLLTVAGIRLHYRRSYGGRFA